MTPPDEPTYRIDVRIAERWTEIALVAQADGPDDRLTDVWAHRFHSMEAAGRIVGAMVKLRREWGRWGRVAGLLGPDFLDGVLDGDLLTVASLSPPARRPDRSGTPKRPQRGPDGATIRMRLLSEGTPSIVASHEGRAFMTLALPTPVQARRVWDWLRWQTAGYRAMFEFSDREGAPALVVLIVARVLDAERRALLTCGPRDPERPLRHWRPAGHVETHETEDGDSDEAFG